MTPMIDCVFQLMIFFIVTINVAERKDPDIRLELAPDGAEVESGADNGVNALIIDINRRGGVSLSGVPVNAERLRNIVRGRYNRLGNTSQIWIRGDARTLHGDIKAVMDVCTSEGFGKVNFIAVKDPRTTEQKSFFAGRRRRP